MEIKKLSEISFKKLGYTPKELRKLVDGKQEAQFLVRIGGVVAEPFSGADKKTGEIWTGFRGIFTALTKDNEGFSSSVCFIPQKQAEKILDKINAGQNNPSFQFDVFVTETDKNPSGYAYLCEPVLSEEAEEKHNLITRQMLGRPLPVNGGLLIENKSVKGKK